MPAQILRPVSDVSEGGWAGSSGSDLFSLVDETVADDTGYISTESFGSACELALSSGLEPSGGIHTGHMLRVRATGNDAVGLHVALVQGVQVIAEWTTSSVPSTPTDLEYTLSEQEASSITDYSDLRIRLSLQSAFAFDTTSLTDRTASWHADLTFRSAQHLLAGYSKSDGTFGVAEHDPDTGAIVDARVIVDEDELYSSINDHFMLIPHVVQNGAHAGTLWCLSLPHGPGTANGGDLRLYSRYSPTGRTSGLIPSDDGNGLDYALSTGTINYGQMQERSDGRLVVLVTDDDASPQALRAVWTDDPAVPVTIGRVLADNSGGNNQVYANAVPGEDADTMRVVMFNHPVVANAAIKTFEVNLSTGEVLIGGVAQGSGSIYDATGSRMTDYGSAPAINAPTGGVFTRVHDLCQYGTYQHGHAVAITQGAQGSDLDAPSHAVLYCDPADDPEVAANWSQVNIGAANRARTWDNGGSSPGRRYNSDIRFLPPQAGEGFRCALIAYDGTDSYRTEVWAGSAPNTAVMVEATAWATSPRPMRIFVNPGAATDDVQALVYGFNSYAAFTNFDPSDVQILSFAPVAPAIVTAPSIGLSPVVGTELEPTDSEASGSPAPSVAYQWEIADDNTGTNAAVIVGETSATYTPIAADETKHLRRVDTWTNSEGSVVTQTNWSNAVTAANVALADHVVILDPEVGITEISGAVDEWTADPDESTVAASFSATSAGVRPLYDAGPPARLDFASSDILTGNAAARGLLRNRTSMAIIAKLTWNGDNDDMAIVFSQDTAGNTLHVLMRVDANGNWGAAFRRVATDSSSTIAGSSAVLGEEVTLALFIDHDPSNPAAELYVDGTRFTGGVPSNGERSGTGTAAAALLGASAFSSVRPFQGEMGMVMMLANNNGGIIADASTILADFESRASGGTPAPTPAPTPTPTPTAFVADNYATMDPSVGVTLGSGSDVTAWASDPDESNTALTFTSVGTPQLIAGPPARLGLNTDVLEGGTAAQSFFTGKSAIGLVGHFEWNGGNDDFAYYVSSPGQGNAFFFIRVDASGNWNAGFRRNGGDPFASISGRAAVLGETVRVALLLDFSSSGSAAELHIDDQVFTGDVPTQGALSATGSNPVVVIGDTQTTGDRPFIGEVGPFQLLAQDSGGLIANADDILSDFDSRFTVWP